MKVSLKKYAEALAESLYGESDKAVVDQKISNFLGLIYRKKKSKILKRFPEIFAKIWRRKNNQIGVKAVVPYVLNENGEEKLCEYLEEIFQKKVVLELVVDEKVIGGLKIMAGDYVIDGTVKKNLEILKQKIANSNI